MSTYKAMNEDRFRQIKGAFASKMSISQTAFDFLVKRRRIDNFQQYEQIIMNEVKDKLTNPTCKTKVSLVVIDSVAGLFNISFGGDPMGLPRFPWQERNMVLRKFSNFLKELAENHNICVVFTNDARAEFDKENNEGNHSKVQPALGEEWSLMIHERLFLKKKRSWYNGALGGGKEGEGVKRSIKVHFGPRFTKKAKIPFAINEFGLTA